MRRGRAWRRNRTAFRVAGGGLAAAAALALALPLAGHGTGPATVDDAAAPAGSAASPARLVPVGWTLERTTSSTMKLTLDIKQIFDADALQSALAGAGIPATVRTAVHCEPKDGELPQADKVYQVETPPDHRFAFIIKPAEMPPGSRLYFSIFRSLEDEKLTTVAVTLVSDNDPMVCEQQR
jgi:hypothetical protein